MKQSMSMFIKETIQLWMTCIIEFLLFLPLWILFRVYLLPSQVDPMWMIVLPILSLVGVLLRYRCKVKWKQLLAALILGGLVGIGSGVQSIYALPIGAAGFICAFLGMNAESLYHRFKMFWVGIAIYFVATIAFRRIPALETSIPLLTWLGSLSLILTLLIYNRNHLQYSTYSEDKETLPKGIKRNNRIYVIAIGIIGAVLATGIGQAIGTFLWNLLRSFFGLFSGSSEPLPPQAERPPIAPLLPTGGNSEPGLLAAIFDIVFYLLGAALVGAIVYYALRWLYKNAGGRLRGAMDALLALLRREHNPQDNRAYLDEEKSVFTWEQTVQSLKEFWNTRFASRNQKDRWDQMNSEQEQVRWLFRRWLLMRREDGYEPKQGLTPKETNKDITKWASNNKHKHKDHQASEQVSDQLIELYEKVRYGEEHPATSEVAALKDRLKL